MLKRVSVSLVKSLLESLVKLPLVVLLFGCFFVSSCSRSSSSEDGIEKPEASSTCISEAKLLAQDNLQGIVGGKRVYQDDKDAKTVAMLLTIENKDMGICTAALISPNVLLTAAHCIKSSAKNAVIFYSAISCESGFDIIKNAQRVEKTVIHPEYIPSTETKEGVNDIAVIILQEKAPADYPIYQIADPDKLTKNDLYFYGYGVIGTNKNGSGMLRKTKFTEDEYKIEKKNRTIKVTQNNGRGICSGDSGGPGLVNIDGESQILGVNSYVRGPKSDYCNGESTLMLAHAYKDWLQKIILSN